MKERPILFSAPMVRALLAGTKWQTRRALKLQPDLPCAIYGSPGADTKITPRLVPCLEGMGVGWHFEMSKIKSASGMSLEAAFIDYEPARIVCPYGQPGDRLWVRETWAYSVHAMAAARDEAGPFVYAADPMAKQQRLCDRWRSPIHMPRWASRILLEVTEVRVERLNDISADDAAAEGWPGPDANNSIVSAYPIAWYSNLWEQINGKGSWALNPWVWAVSFRVLKGPQP